MSGSSRTLKSLKWLLYDSISLLIMKVIILELERCLNKLISLQELLNEEIEDCIDSVAKLAPLVPQYIDYNSAEVGSAALMIGIKHSIKTIHQEAK
mmetsp:Transcript_9349/g.8252  ORF Transcript_9349/g.8252 Transcript_9349/m.8252 type:complete len:96 (+) Transcript_9349:371-658(+)